MSQPAVFFDRDNTLIINGDYLGDPEKVVLMPGAADAVARVRDLGFLVVVVSNQSGVARGLFTEADVIAVDDRMAQLLLADNPKAKIDRQEFCPYHPAATVVDYLYDSERRKPKPGMMIDAAKALDIDLKESWVIGDAPRDIDAGKRAGCRGIFLHDASVIKEDRRANERGEFEADYSATSLEDAIDFIEMQMTAPKTVPKKFPMTAPMIDPKPSPMSDPLRPIEKSAPIISPVLHDLSNTSDEHAPQIVALDIEPIAQSLHRVEHQLSQVVDELRRASEPQNEFSVARLISGVLMGISLASLFAALLYRDDLAAFQSLMMIGIFLQVLVTSLLLMASK
ncbi:MAG TPA: HAD family hydrolase [Tepidisphaeraceae bacterium]|nr:HAD family hydrolase [Tepidisphaeraceae bacterium]